MFKLGQISLSHEAAYNLDRLKFRCLIKTPIDRREKRSGKGPPRREKGNRIRLANLMVIRIQGTVFDSSSIQRLCLSIVAFALSANQFDVSESV